MAGAPKWWEEYPARLKTELDLLTEYGISFTRDEHALEFGVLRLHLFPVVGDQTLKLVATFPDSYPYFPFEVTAPDLSLPHHQHAGAKTLCLLPRATRWWHPATDTLADFIRDRLPLVLKLGSADADRNDTDAFQEERQAEPYSDYYAYEPNALLLADGEWQVPTLQRSGFLEIGVPSPPPGHQRAQILNGAVLAVQDESRKALVSASLAISGRHREKLHARWVRFDSPLPADLSAREIFQKACHADPKLGAPQV